MKIKHNKKRNTAVVYEALLKDMTAAILKGDAERKAAVISVIKEHFSRGTVLGKDLSCYRNISKNYFRSQEAENGYRQGKAI